MADQDQFVADPTADTEVLDDEPRSILLGLISQLTKGMDLHRVTLPTFVLEPRSMLERITDFMSHPDLLISASKVIDPTERFVQVLCYFLSGWHIRPKGVKKPYNPVLGEFFRCCWKFADGTEAFYVAEQVSHHPPISAYYFTSPENHIQIQGELRPRSKFLGNSAASIMDGYSRISFPQMSGRDGEVYEITYPNIYARGILFGTMMMELGDSCTFRCDKNDLMAELEFTTKGFFSGHYNGIKGKVKKISSGETLFNISGKWSEKILIQKAGGSSQPQTVLFDAEQSKIVPKLVAAEAQQDDYESRKLWQKLTAALHKRDMDTATAEKTQVEDRERKIRNSRETDPATVPGHCHRFFVKDPNQDSFKILNAEAISKMPPQEAKQKLHSFIFHHQAPESK
ncbi:hypothetical protein MP228_007398 [Amoeboaphelidium protococcarum]|nr:hypothetical protein MP228_007398 [Amoeboaphelidium protococcarum]